MKPSPFIFCLCLAACSNEANHLGNPLLLPISGIGNAFNNAAYAQRRGAVELLVKSNHGALIEEIAVGGGPLLDEAMETANIPQAERPARILQLQGDIGLYTDNLEALIVALMVYGN